MERTLSSRNPGSSTESFLPRFSGSRPESPMPAGGDLAVLEHKLAEGEINLGVWLCYFPGYDSSTLPSCRDCEAHAVCRDGRDKDPLRCFTTPGRHYR